ncbi:AbrB family transcriptional regulator [Microcella alkaliphila]|uniref:AbrB family transcriptional regulator n=1 Tax=Microcella alkaliphila TaxID=279828 RepID=A0A4Q7TAE5_9MICO|nr:AbrB/MazE/SpoVT family DNA-binding domain-containing protein [Microcella alkaliphila]RZT57374.1 AbrB family transcriptional regulator [Microcella alkaliphila]
MIAPTVTAATMTSKGQLTVPRDVREALGLTAGVSVAFVLHADGSCELVPRTSRISELAGVAATGATLSLDDMADAVAEGAASS